MDYETTQHAKQLAEDGSPVQRQTVVNNLTVKSAEDRLLHHNPTSWAGRLFNDELAENWRRYIDGLKASQG